jgi:hypothetical protein
MKCRTCFVSNSSSSSFVIHKDDLTKDQIWMIENHITVSKQQDTYYYIDDPWFIDDDRFFLKGHTSLDNFDMYHYMENIVKVDMFKVKWNED